MYYTATKDTLNIILDHKERVLALRAKISITRSDITSIKYFDVFSEWSDFMVRMPGSFLPRWVIAGSYWTTDGWDFVYALRPRGLNRPIVHNVLVISTKNDKFRRVIVEMPQETADEIIVWWGSALS